MKFPKCIRCGLCCKHGECEYGKFDKVKGYCVYLEKEGEVYSCSINAHKKFASGCPMKKFLPQLRIKRIFW